jgi:hypothetical protein
MVMLALLGFSDFSRALPLNDKLLHFICFTFATGVFYFIVDVEECAFILIRVSLSLNCEILGVHEEYGFGDTLVSRSRSSLVSSVVGY